MFRFLRRLFRTADDTACSPPMRILSDEEIERLDLDILTDDQLRQVVASKAMRTGNITIANRDEDGHVTLEVLGPPTDSAAKSP